MKQEDKGTVAISLVAYSVALATRRGVAAEPLLAQAGIAPALLGQPRARVSAQQYGALWNAIARTLDDEFFGQDRHPMRSGSFIAMSQAALSARDGLHAMARAVNFMHCVLDDLHAELDANPQRVRLRFVHRNNGATPAMFTYATYFIIVYGLTCWLIGRRIPLLHASFRCDTPPADHEYPSMFCDDMRFNERFVCRFRSRIRDAAGRAEREDAEDVPAQRAGELHRQVPQPERARAARARGAARDAARRVAGAGGMAARLHVAEATLRRKLHQEGHAYQSIKDTLRRDLAFEALADPGRTIADVAAATGFAEPSAFYRAFRKWSRRSPADYRDEVLARGGGAS